jgi:hypothetical protein
MVFFKYISGVRIDLREFIAGNEIICTTYFSLHNNSIAVNLKVNHNVTYLIHPVSFHPLVDMATYTYITSILSKYIIIIKSKSQPNYKY